MYDKEYFKLWHEGKTRRTIRISDDLYAKIKQEMHKSHFWTFNEFALHAIVSFLERPKELKDDNTGDSKP